jgi:hypothetical protein
MHELGRMDDFCSRIELFRGTTAAISSPPSLLFVIQKYDLTSKIEIVPWNDLQ